MPDDADAPPAGTRIPPSHVVLRPARGRKVLGWSLLVLGVIGLVLPFLQGFLFLALGVYVLRDQHIWAADRWAWVARKWPGAVESVEALDAKMTARVAGWGTGLRRALRIG